MLTPSCCATTNRLSPSLCTPLHLFSCFCKRVEDVISVLTLVRSGAAQVCNVLRAEELREELEVEEEEEGKEDGQEEEEEVESGEGRVKEKPTIAHMDDHG